MLHSSLPPCVLTYDSCVLFHPLHHPHGRFALHDRLDPDLILSCRGNRPSLRELVSTKDAYLVCRQCGRIVYPGGFRRFVSSAWQANYRYAAQAKRIFTGSIGLSRLSIIERIPGIQFYYSCPTLDIQRRGGLHSKTSSTQEPETRLAGDIEKFQKIHAKTYIVEP